MPLQLASLSSSFIFAVHFLAIHLTQLTRLFISRGEFY
jgi:hypothetical protein